MTELQIGVFGLCAIGVVTVVVYNTWQEYRYRKLAEKVLNVQHTDVLLDQTSVGETSNTGHADSVPEAVFASEVIHEYQIPQAPPETPSERIEPVFRPDLEPQETRPAYQATDTTDARPDVISETATFVPAPAPPPVITRPVEETRDIKDVPEPYHLLSPMIDYV